MYLMGRETSPGEHGSSRRIHLILLGVNVCFGCEQAMCGRCFAMYEQCTVLALCVRRRRRENPVCSYVHILYKGVREGGRAKCPLPALGAHRMVPPVTMNVVRTGHVGAISRPPGDDGGGDVPVLDVERRPWGPICDDMTITIAEFLVYMCI